MKKSLCFALSCLIAVSMSVMAPLVGSAAGKSYSTDFNSTNDLKEWKMYQADKDGNNAEADCYEVKNGMMTPKKAGQILGAVYTGSKYKNVLIETSIDKMSRIEFCCDSDSPWADKRFYVEVDFGGAVLIRTGEDREIASQLVSGLVSREQTQVKIRIYGKTIEVYLNGGKTPSLKRVDEDGTFTATEGYVGIMTVWQNPSVDYFRITELDEKGMLNGVDPITGKGSGTTNKGSGTTSKSSTPSVAPSRSSVPTSPSASVPSSASQVSVTEASSANAVSSEPAESAEESAVDCSSVINSSVTLDGNMEENNGLSGGAIIAIIIAAVIIIGGGAAVLIFYLKRKNTADQ